MPRPAKISSKNLLFPPPGDAQVTTYPYKLRQNFFSTWGALAPTVPPGYADGRMWLSGFNANILWCRAVSVVCDVFLLAIVLNLNVLKDNAAEANCLINFI